MIILDIRTFYILRNWSYPVSLEGRVRSETVPGVKKVVLNGNSEIGAHVRSNLYYLSRLRHLIRLRAVTHRIFSF